VEHIPRCSPPDTGLHFSRREGGYGIISDEFDCIFWGDPSILFIVIEILIRFAVSSVGEFSATTPSRGQGDMWERNKVEARLVDPNLQVKS